MNSEQASILLEDADNVLKDGKILYQRAIDLLEKDDPDFVKIEKGLKTLRPGLDTLMDYLKSRIKEITDNNYHIEVTNRSGKVVVRIEADQTYIDTEIMPRIKDPADTEYHMVSVRRLG